MMRTVLRHPIQFHRDHRFARSEASAFLDGDLDQDGHRRVEEHAQACPPCARFLASLRRTVTALHTLRDSETPTVAEGVLERLRNEEQPRRPNAAPD
jgi:anti-sigma factor RsiW